MAFECPYCANLSIELLVDLAKTELSGLFFPQKAFYRHQPSLGALEEAATKGCSLCSLVVEYLKSSRDHVNQWPYYTDATQLPSTDVKIALNSSHIRINEQLEKVQVFDTLMVHIGPWEDIGEEATEEELDAFYARLPTLEFNIVNLLGTETMIEHYRIGRRAVDTDLGSLKNFAIANRWLDECQRIHKCLSDAPRELPTRVIDVGLSLTEHCTPPRLTLSHGKKDTYVALSHCWGGKITPVLTRDNIEPFQLELPYQTLPANFQDAIKITRNLGIRYLWIDSLCILQDSKHDWEVESKRMLWVYRNATLTISASASKGSTDGILRKHPVPTPELEPAYLRLLADPGRDGLVKIEVRDEDEETLRRLESGPLSRRGWTLQESILGPRQLFYGKYQIFWRCPLGFQTSDGLPAGPRTHDNDFATLSTVLYGDRLPAPTLQSIDTEQVLIDYYELVEQYSHRRLTYASDKLPAFSGLAQGVQKAIGGIYLAGHWHSDFARSLLWYGDLECKHVQPYRAPSWSWAVTDEPILYQAKSPPKSKKWMTQLLSHQIISKDTDNPYGEIVSGHVEVEGPTKSFIRSNQVIDLTDERFYIGGCRFDDLGPQEGIHIQRNLYRMVDDNGDDFILSMNTRTGPQKGWDVDPELFDSETYLAILVHVPDSIDGEYAGSDAEGLVVRKIVENEEEQYERVGYFHLNPPKMSWLDSWTSQKVKLV